jgi:hypothetical protein
MPERIVFSESQLEYLRVHYPNEPVLDISDYLGISPGRISKEAKKLGLKKAEGWSTKQYCGRYVKNYRS